MIVVSRFFEQQELDRKLCLPQKEEMLRRSKGFFTISSCFLLRIVVVVLILAVCFIQHDAFVSHFFNTRSNRPSNTAVSMAKSKVGQTYQEQQELGRLLDKGIAECSQYISRSYHHIHCLIYEICLFYHGDTFLNFSYS